MSTPDIRVVHDMDPNSTGAIVYWSVAGGDCNHGALVEALSNRGFDDTKQLPPLPTPKVAFHRAVHQFTTEHRFVRRSKAVATYHLIDEREDDGDLEFSKNVKLSLNAGNMVKGEGDDPENLTERVTMAYMEQMGRVANTDISAWLVKQTARCAAVSLRPTGGFYFIPADRMDDWNTIVDAIHDATPYEIYAIPAMPSDETVRSVLDAILREASSEAAAIGADLAADELGGRALRTRAARAEAMAQKVEKYEAILGQKIEDYREQLEQLSAQSVQAAMKVEAEEDAKRSA